MLTIHQQRQRLDNLFDAARGFTDDELRSHWSKYLCVLVSGFLENSVEMCFGEYTRRRSEPPVANYVTSQLQGFQNPKMEKILQLVECFNPEWKTQLEAATQGKLSDSVNSIVGNRHRIAHGQSVALSMGSLRAYYDDAKAVVALLEKTCEV